MIRPAIVPDRVELQQLIAQRLKDGAVASVPGAVDGRLQADASPKSALQRRC